MYKLRACMRADPYFARSAQCISVYIIYSMHKLDTRMKAVRDLQELTLPLFTRHWLGGQ